MARGSIYPRQLKSGATVFDVRYRSSNGRQCQKRGFARKRDAERYLADQLALVHQGRLIVSDIRYGAYFDAWLAEHRPRLEPGTHADYEVHGRLRLKPFFGELKLSSMGSATRAACRVTLWAGWTRPKPDDPRSARPRCRRRLGDGGDLGRVLQRG